MTTNAASEMWAQYHNVSTKMLMDNLIALRAENDELKLQLAQYRAEKKEKPEDGN